MSVDFPNRADWIKTRAAVTRTVKYVWASTGFSRVGNRLVVVKARGTRALGRNAAKRKLGRGKERRVWKKFFQRGGRKPVSRFERRRLGIGEFDRTPRSAE